MVSAFPLSYSMNGQVICFWSFYCRSHKLKLFLHVYSEVSWWFVDSTHTQKSDPFSWYLILHRLADYSCLLFYFLFCFLPSTFRCLLIFSSRQFRNWKGDETCTVRVVRRLTIVTKSKKKEAFCSHWKWYRAVNFVLKKIHWITNKETFEDLSESAISVEWPAKAGLQQIRNEWELRRVKWVWAPI